MEREMDTTTTAIPTMTPPGSAGITTPSSSPTSSIHSTSTSTNNNNNNNHHLQTPTITTTTPMHHECHSPIDHDHLPQPTIAEKRVLVMNLMGHPTDEDPPNGDAHREYRTLCQVLRRPFMDTADDDDEKRHRIVNRFFDRFLFVQTDGITPVSHVQAREQILQDLYDPTPSSSVFVPPVAVTPSPPPITTTTTTTEETTSIHHHHHHPNQLQDDSNNHETVAAVVAAAAAAACTTAASNDDDQKCIPEKNQSSSGTVREEKDQKIVVPYGKHAKKSREYSRFRDAWKLQYQTSTPEERRRIIQDALNHFSFVREDNGQELAQLMAWRKVQKDFEKHWLMPTQFDNNSLPTSPFPNKPSSIQNVISPDTSMLVSSLQETVSYSNNHLTSDDESTSNTTTTATRVESNRAHQFHDEKKSDHTTPNRTIQRTSKKLSAATKEDKSVVFMGRWNRVNEEYLRFRFEWKSIYAAGSSEEKVHIINEVLRRFVFVREDGTKADLESSRKKIHKDFQRFVSPPKPCIPQPNKQPQDLPKPCIPQPSKQPQDRSKRSSKGTLAKSQSSNSKAKSRNPQAKLPSKTSTENTLGSQPTHSKPVVYGGPLKGKGNIAYIARLREKKWDYVNAETKEEAEKVVDSFLETFIFQTTSPEAARKKVSRALQDIGHRVAKEKFRWFSHAENGDHPVATVANHLSTAINPKERPSACTPGKISCDLGSASKALSASKSCKRDASKVMDSSPTKNTRTKRMRADDDSRNGTTPRMATRSHDSQMISKDVGTQEEKNPRCDPEIDSESVQERGQAEEGNTIAETIQKTLSEAIQPFASQMSRTNQKSNAFLQSQQYLDAAKLFQELGDSENAKKMMTKYMKSLNESEAST